MAKVNWDGDLPEQQIIPQQEMMDNEQEPAYRSSFGGGGGVIVPLKELRSSNLKGNESGWILNRNGNVEFNGAVTSDTNFQKVASFKGVTLYVSDGTTPNGNLSGTAGDVCFNGPGGQPFYCGGTTTWTGM